MTVTIDRIAAIIADVAREEILTRFRSLGESGVRTKSHDRDLVTDADVAAEKALTRRLTAELPGSVVVGEEATYHDKSLLNRIDGEDPVWIVDPVDGTSNFAHGRETFATMVALTRGGTTVMGWIWDPIKEVLVAAEEGCGAFRNGDRLTITDPGPLSGLSGSPGFKVPKRMQGAFARHMRHGSAAHDYMAMAEGRMHFSVYRRLMPWDHAAGILVHREAGGYDALIDGTPYAPTIHGGTVIVAPTRDLWQQIHDLIEA